MSRWITAQASVIGSSHIKSSISCQDSHVVKTTPDGEWLVIVVSDGAGTASKAEEGSTHVTDYFAKEMLALVNELKQRTPGNWINDFVISKVLQTREALRNLANSDAIKDYNCTLVACLIGPSGGFSIHIGDGSIIGGSFSDNSEIKFLSEPENGEYSNETYFITEGNWVKHLRVMPMPKLDWVICCTDGGGDIALVADKEPKQGFLYPVVKAVFEETEADKRNSKLRFFLEDPKAHQATSDDITLVLAVKQDFQLSFGNAFKFRDDLKNALPKNNSSSASQNKPKPNQNKKNLTIDKKGQSEINLVTKPKVNSPSFWKFFGVLVLLCATFVAPFQFEISRKWIATKLYNVSDFLSKENSKKDEELDRKKSFEQSSETLKSRHPEKNQTEEKSNGNIDQTNVVTK
jgi:hypothetical protein